MKACHDQFGSIDVLVNSAGTDFWGAIEEQNETFDVSLFGAVELIRLVLPEMRLQRRGTIVNISSLRGIVSVGGNGYYCSTKFALEGLTEALWQEIEPVGLGAFLVEPGPHRTGMDTRVRFSGSRIDAYEGSTGRLLKTMATIKPEQFPEIQQRPRLRSTRRCAQAAGVIGRSWAAKPIGRSKQDSTSFNRNSSLPKTWPSAVTTQTRVRVFYDEVVISVYSDSARLSASPRQDSGRK